MKNLKAAIKFLEIVLPQFSAVYASGRIHLIARITTGRGHGQSIPLPIPDDADRLTAYAAVQAHYEALYGPHVKISVDHLSSTPEDEDEGTVRHSASVTAQCDHGLTERICTVNVVTQREVRS